MFDVIIVSDGRTPALRNVTQNCIDSIFGWKHNRDLVNIIVVETGEGITYIGARTVKYGLAPFNYHKYLNYGVGLGDSQYIVLSNNDVIYDADFFKAVHKRMTESGVRSLSPLSNDKRQANYSRGNLLIPGYDIGTNLTGWCIVLERKLWEQMGGLDPGVDFWYSDNLYADQLKFFKVRHYLFTGAYVDHLESKTLSEKDIATKVKLMHGQLLKYKKARRKYR